MRHARNGIGCAAIVRDVPSPVVACSRVRVVREGRTVLGGDAGITWTHREGEHWVVMGPNGAGKTTLARIAAARAFPTSGSVSVLGAELGACDLSELRTCVGWAAGELAGDIPHDERVVDAIMTGAHAVTGRWREAYATADETRARDLAARWGLEPLLERSFGTISEGERKRTLLARALMSDPELIVLDEPAAGLDLSAREALVAGLAALAREPGGPAIVLVTHHVEEIPEGFTHAMLLRDGHALAAGRVEAIIADQPLSEAFATPVHVVRAGGRFAAVGAARP